MNEWIKSSHIATGGQSISMSCCRALYYSLTVTVLFFRAPSLTWGRVCLLYMLLALARVVFFGSESRGTCDYILLSQIRGFPFRRFLRLAGSRLRYSTPSPYGWRSKNQSFYDIRTYGQSASRPVCLGFKHPTGAYEQIFITVRQLRVCWCGALSDERKSLPFTIAAGPRQRSHSWVWVPRDSWPYFTVSNWIKSKVLLRPRVQPASLSRNKVPICGFRPDLYYCQTVAGLFMWGALSYERTVLCRLQDLAVIRLLSVCTILHVTSYKMYIYIYI
jgi:hypothetical protein